MNDFFTNNMPDIVSFLLEFSESMVCMTLLALFYKRRKLFLLRYVGAAIAGVIIAFLFSAIKSNFNDDITAPVSIVVRIVLYTVFSLYILGVIFFCWKENFCESVICWCVTIAVKTVAGKSYQLFLNMAGVDGINTMSFFSSEVTSWYDYALLAVYHSALFVLFAFLNKKRAKQQYDKMTAVFVGAISFCTVLIVFVLSSIARVYESVNLQLSVVTRIFSVVCMLFVLALIFIFLEKNRLSNDLEITEQLLMQEKRRYETAKDSVEAINMKVHDLKHRLSEIENKLDEGEIASLKEAIKIYDSNIKTGNEVLDVVLYEKQLYCNKNGIRLTCLADGKTLSFMAPTHIYSLFSNAIDNAAEAVIALDEEERIIGISVKKETKNTVIEIYNYFDGKTIIENSVPISSKPDKNRHGYGIKSMRYIAENYGGTLSVRADDDVFTLSVVFPCL